MKDPTTEQPPDDGRTAHERFTELGRRVMSVPKAEADRREKAWKAKRPSSPRRKGK